VELIARTARWMWWAVAVAAAGAFVAAAVIAPDLVDPVLAVGAWLLVGGAVVLGAGLRAPDGFRSAIPFAGGGIASLLLGLVAFVLPGTAAGSAIVATGLWVLILGATCLSVSRIGAALGIPDGGLALVAWAAIMLGIVISTLPIFTRGAAELGAGIALVAAGTIGLLAAQRLRVLPQEPRPAISRREARRQERQGRRR
jgi:hypothetical protein